MIYDMLFDWQKKIVDKYLNRDSLGLFLDMGVGKTPISLAFAEKNNCSKILIITLNNKALENESNKGSFMWWIKKMKLPYKIYTKKSKLFNFNNDSPEVLIINYESLYERNKDSKYGKAPIRSNIVEFIKSCSNKNVAIIVDESHKLKDTSSIQTLATTKIKKSINLVANKTYLYLLTGTPFTVGYIDLYSQLKLLGCPLTKTSFIDEYCVRGNIYGLLGWQQPIVGYKNVDDLYKLVHNYAITIKSDDVISLPDKIFVNHVQEESIDFTMFTKEMIEGNKINNYIRRTCGDEGKDIYNKKAKCNNPFYRNIDWPSNEYLCETVSSFWLRCRQLSIGFLGNSEKSKWFNTNRLKQLKTFLEQNVDNYVIFYNYTPELLELFNICESLNYNIDVYCGEIKSLDNYIRYSKESESYKLTNKKNVILANFASGSTGMNWQEYNKCIIFSIPLYKDWEQGLKRIHRIGQKNVVFYHIFYQNNFLDRSMISALKENIQYNENLFEKDLNDINI